MRPTANSCLLTEIIDTKPKNIANSLVTHTQQSKEQVKFVIHNNHNTPHEAHDEYNNNVILTINSRRRGSCRFT
jgi:hypothetical protein